MLTGGLLWLAVTVASVAVGEALALLWGTALRPGRRGPWATPVHVAFLLGDIIAGGAVIWLAVGPGGAAARAEFATALAVLTATHAWRAWEYRAGRPDPFLANRQLYQVDVGKLAGLVLVLVWWIAR